ncbi:hypothetical protein RHSIM_Rhsim02G0119000 [Rhododendron simsii]|uniref:Uncharacterized protein n=1 Tax=Rhododendron simsii TaxID=118357 RepID=A0A834LWB4_RHOSS|nr:hypothetical protein RHSIM_Rhsim02G0119000 [Rhododendron simsii]
MGRAPSGEKNGLKKGPWTQEEDQKLVDYIQKHGYGNWRTLPKNAGLQRCGKSCRLRWTNYLRPDIKRGRFSFEEEQTIIQLHSVLGNKWSVIAARLPGRTDNEIKNYWNTNIRKRLLRMGIDPVTHSPRLDLFDLSSILTISSLYNPCEIDLSRLFGVQQPLLNPEFSRLATSLGNPHRVQNQLAPVVQEISNCSSLTSPYVTFASEAQVMESNLDQFSSNFTAFSPVGCQLNEWQSNEMPYDLWGDCLPQLKFGYCGSNQSITNPPPSDHFHWNKGSNFGLGSGLSTLSTPPSSPAPLDSTSTHIGFDGSSTTSEERGSYSCGNMLKFGIPDMVNVNEFV